MAIDALPSAHRSRIAPWRTTSEFEGTEYVIWAAALPEEPALIPIHGASADAVQLHGVPNAVTLALNVPPPIETDCLDGEMPSTHWLVDCGVVGVELLLPHAV